MWHYVKRALFGDTAKFTGKIVNGVCEVSKTYAATLGVTVSAHGEITSPAGPTVYAVAVHTNAGSNKSCSVTAGVPTPTWKLDTNFFGSTTFTIKVTPTPALSEGTAIDISLTYSD